MERTETAFYAMSQQTSVLVADAITSSPAPKILLPLHQEPIILVGTSKEPLPHLVDHLMKRVQDILGIVTGGYNV